MSDIARRVLSAPASSLVGPAVPPVAEQPGLFAVGVCARCHDRQPEQTTVAEWKLSKHAKTVTGALCYAKSPCFTSDFGVLGYCLRVDSPSVCVILPVLDEYGSRPIPLPQSSRHFGAIEKSPAEGEG